MPRLGTSDEATPNQSGSSMRTAMAYPNFRNTYLWKMLGIFLTFFLLRNLMFKVSYNEVFHIPLTQLLIYYFFCKFFFKENFILQFLNDKKMSYL